LVQELDSRHVDTRGLGRVGYFLGSPYVTLASDRWQATGGTTGVVFSDLTGVNLWGKGASFAGGFERWRVAALAGRPVAGGPGPGGSGAFARVRNELSGFGTRALAGGVLLSGGYWRSDDENPAFSRLHSSGWSLSPQIAVDSNTTAGIEARGTSFDATGASGA